MTGRRDWLTSANDVVFRQRPGRRIAGPSCVSLACHGRMIPHQRRRCKLSMPWDWKAGAATACRGCAKV